MTGALPPSERPFTAERFSTAELPDTPTRSFRIPAAGWLDAPEQLLRLGAEIDEDVEYKRRIGPFLLWRAGPPIGRAIYLAIDAGDLERRYRFDLHGRQGSGWGPDGVEHVRFRAWKESLLAEAKRS